MKRAVAALLVASLLGAAPASAGSLHIESLTADGLTVRDLSCTLDADGLLALLQVVASLAKQKRALDACVASGGAFQVAWDLRDGAARHVEVRKSSHPGRASCIAHALEATTTTAAGRCEAIVLVGDAAGARGAADRIGGKR